MSGNKEMQFIAGAFEMSLTPETIESVIKQWKAENPGRSIDDMPSDVFVDRMMDALLASAKKVQ